MTHRFLLAYMHIKLHFRTEHVDEQIQATLHYSLAYVVSFSPKGSERVAEIELCLSCQSSITKK